MSSKTYTGGAARSGLTRRSLLAGAALAPTLAACGDDDDKKTPAGRAPYGCPVIRCRADGG